MYISDTKLFIILQGYLDALRIEVANDGIDVLSICPGPVHSSFMRDVLGTSLEKVKVFTKLLVLMLMLFLFRKQ